MSFPAGQNYGDGFPVVKPNEQYHLRWHTFHDHLSAGLKELFNDLKEGDTDVTLMVEGQNLHCHKWLLSMCSPLFKKMFKVSGNFKVIRVLFERVD